MTTASVPGTILANVPGVLGFYPQDSLILAAFDHSEDGTYTMGPMLRLDESDPLLRSALAHAALGIGQADLVFAFIVSNSFPDYGDISPADYARHFHNHQSTHAHEHIFAAISQFVTDLGAELAGVWGTKRILTDGQFVALTDSATLRHNRWQFGAIAPVTSTEAMKPWIEAGKLPDVDPNDARARLSAPNPCLNEEQRAALEDDAEALSWSFERDGFFGSDAVMDALAQASEELHFIDAQGVTHEDLMSQTDVLTDISALLCTSRHRDALIAEVLDYPEAASELMIAVARTTTGVRRSNALCCYAIAQIDMGFPMVALPALKESALCIPDHSLTTLLFVLLNAGATQRARSAMRAGAAAAVQSLLEPPPDVDDEPDTGEQVA